MFVCLCYANFSVKNYSTSKIDLFCTHISHV